MILKLLFPPKCVFCTGLLRDQETDLCKKCRQTAPMYEKPKIKLSFLAQWTAIWYYKENVRSSICRYKFSGRRSYAQFFGQQLAMHIRTQEMDSFDLLTWVPVSAQRKFIRGYDQMELVCKVVASELGVPYAATLRKARNTPPQSGIGDVARRRANVLGAYQVLHPEQIQGKNILLLDDVLTTGATACECARMLLTAGANRIDAAVLAAPAYDKK